MPTLPRAGVFVLAALCLLPCAAGAQAPPPEGAAGACTIVGPVLGPSDFGVAAGQPVADATAALLPDGRVRLYTYAQGRGIVSAISLTTEGASFAAEAGSRLPDGSGMPRIVASPSGGWRLYFSSGGGIKSAASADGLTFTIENGFRVTQEAAGFTGTTVSATTGPTVIRLASGRYRMYFSDLPRPGDPPGGHRIKSALSSDQLTWTVEPGVRIGPGAPVLADSAEHPFALANADGSVTLYYGKFTGGSGGASPEGLYHSTSADGLGFEQETYDVFFGNDPDALRLADGTLVLYYGQFDPQVGGTINLARCPEPTAAATPSRGAP
ncbi:MAG: hypothetical protein HY824_02635 [Acidobacteria bacterium]|nr:hypothetical protein [Acidobacteriota bacterium]